MKLALFDLDGTLTDPGIGITNSVRYALEKYGITVSDRSELYRFVGPPLAWSFSEYYGFSQEKSQDAVRKYREYFRDRGIYENDVYDGIPEMLDGLKKSGISVALATSKPDVFSVEILRHFDLLRYFDFIGANNMEETRVKKSDVIKWTLDNLGVDDVSETVMVGDRKYDIEGAKSFGMKTIAVSYGYGSIDELKSAGADCIVDSVEELKKALTDFFNQ